MSNIVSGQKKELYNQKEIDKLPEDYQRIYYEQLAAQQKLAKESAERKKTEHPPRKGVTYMVPKGF